jgi:5-methyltetrahydrofolate--homocysteine methyltransferase
MMGLTPTDVAGVCHGMTPRPFAYGANCGVGAAELVAALVNMSGAVEPGDIIVAKGNCGVPYFVKDHIHYDGTPELMADYARMARDAGARIIGGCCGTTPAHLRAMRAALDGYEPGAKPTLPEIVSRLGKISTGAEKQAAGANGEPDGTARRRSRRRAGNAAE